MQDRLRDRSRLRDPALLPDRRGTASGSGIAVPGGTSRSVRACARNAQCLSGTCANRPGDAMGVCCNTDCDNCGTCDSDRDLRPIAAGTTQRRLHRQRQRSDAASAAACATASARCEYPAAGTTCGTCKACNGVGLCNVKPDDDTRLRHHRLRRARHELPRLPRPDDASAARRSGACKAPNTAPSCTDVTNVPARARRRRRGRAVGSAVAAAGGGAHGQRTRARTRGGGGGGGGGCCQVGSGPTPDGLGGAARAGGRPSFRRRRRRCCAAPAASSRGVMNDGTRRPDHRPAARRRRRPGRSARGDGGRRVPRAAQDRRGRDGVGLRGRPARHRQARRDQGAGAAHRRQPRAGAPLRRRGARGQQDRPPQHRRHLLVRPAARPAPLLRDGVPRRRRAWPTGSSTGRSRPTRRGACCARSARRSRRRTARGSSTATSSPTTSASCSRSTASRSRSCSTSASPS